MVLPQSSWPDSAPPFVTYRALIVPNGTSATLLFVVQELAGP